MEGNPLNRIDCNLAKNMTAAQAAQVLAALIAEIGGDAAIVIAVAYRATADENAKLAQDISRILHP